MAVVRRMARQEILGGLALGNVRLSHQPLRMNEGRMSIPRTGGKAMQLDNRGCADSTV